MPVGCAGLRWLALAALVTACATAAPPTTTPSRFIAERGGDRLVVFVHGIAGDSVSTWRNRATGAYWPELLATDPAMAGFDVYVVGFASPLLSRASTIEEIAQRLLQQFRDRGFFSRYRQIHFVTHSMGGLVIKRLLTELNRPAEAETLRRVRTVVLISTRSLGAPIAELAALLSLNPQTRDMAPADLNTFLQGLENQWQTLLRDRDTAGLVFPRAYCAYETRPTSGVMVVSRVYASTRCDATPYRWTSTTAPSSSRPAVRPTRTRGSGRDSWRRPHCQRTSYPGPPSPRDHSPSCTTTTGSSTGRRSPSSAAIQTRECARPCTYGPRSRRAARIRSLCAGCG